MIGEVERRLGAHRREVGLYAGIIAFASGAIKRRKHHRREDADDGDDDEQFNKSTTAIFFHRLILVC